MCVEVLHVFQLNVSLVILLFTQYDYMQLEILD